MIEYSQNWTTNGERFSSQSLYRTYQQVQEITCETKLCLVNYDNIFLIVQIRLFLSWKKRSDWLSVVIISHPLILFSSSEQRRSQKFYDFVRTVVRWFLSSPFTLSLAMEHSSLDLSIVKKEPGFDEPFSSESGLFDNMMSDDFHDTNFHSLVSAVSFIKKKFARYLMLAEIFLNLKEISYFCITASEQWWSSSGLAFRFFRRSSVLCWYNFELQQFTRIHFKQFTIQFVWKIALFELEWP